MRLFFLLALWLGLGSILLAQDSLETDAIETSAGPLKITFIGHGSLMFEFNGKVIHVDPYAVLTDYSKLPKADLILVTHDHPDHLNPAVIRALRKEQTLIFLTAAAAKRVDGGAVMKNGGSNMACGVRIEAVPAYNIVHKTDSGQLFHPKGAGNGYILTFGDKRVYVAGDTENIPEMKALTGISVAFLPMNLPYTMTPEMVADAALAFKPKVLYPYHYGETKVATLLELLKGAPEIEVRMRRMK